MRAYKLPLTISREEFLEKKRSDARFREAVYAWVLSVDRLLQCRSAFARFLGLTPSQFAILMGLAAEQKSLGVTIKDLAEHLELAPTHVTTEIGRLERKGLLVKKENHEDRRSVLVSLSSKGEQEIARVSPLVRGVNDLLFHGIGPGSLTMAHQVARTLIDNSEEALTYVRRAADKEIQATQRKRIGRQ